MDATNQPLVSVPVVTYNSALFILETLESIKAQTYQNIELIISDDCSTDNTVELCQKWIEENKKRFIRTQIITVAENTGVSANLNRAEAACQGEWVKPIAGDDLLLPDCIETCINYVSLHNSKCLFGKIEAFGNDVEYATYLTNIFSSRNDEMSKMSLNDLFDMIVEGLTPPAPAFFYNRIFFEDNEINNDERIPMIEDLPKWLNIIKKGITIDFLDCKIVKYRLGGISNSSKWHTPLIYASQRKMYYYYQFEHLYKKNKTKTVEELIQYETNIYKLLYNDSMNVRRSKAYRLGYMILYPFKCIKQLWRQVKKYQ